MVDSAELRPTHISPTVKRVTNYRPSQTRLGVAGFHHPPRPALERGGQAAGHAEEGWPVRSAAQAGARGLPPWQLAEDPWWPVAGCVGVSSTRSSVCVVRD